jgi:hypothetical protein
MKIGRKKYKLVESFLDSKMPNSRKPIAVFFARVKNELGYKKDG